MSACYGRLPGGFQRRGNADLLNEDRAHGIVLFRLLCSCWELLLKKRVAEWIAAHLAALALALAAVWLLLIGSADKADPEGESGFAPRDEI
jgi:hypothetical protein